jgi:outer membrane cobalamin receptor
LKLLYILNCGTRIEIIRGPGLAIFGTNAFVGVINLVPYTAEDIAGVEISAAGGSFSSQAYTILAGQSFGALSLSGFVRYADTNGAQRTVPADAQTSLDMQMAPLMIPPASRAPPPTTTVERLMPMYRWPIRA